MQVIGRRCGNDAADSERAATIRALLSSASSSSNTRWERHASHDAVNQRIQQTAAIIGADLTADEPAADAKKIDEFQKLVDMGFSREKIEKALLNNNNDYDKAFEQLLGQHEDGKDRELECLVEMFPNFPRNVCEQALKQEQGRNLNAAANWLIEQFIEAYPDEVTTTDVKRLLMLGFERTPAVRKLHTHKFDFALALYDLFEPFLNDHRKQIEQTKTNTVSQKTEAGGNCLFHALFGALRNLHTISKGEFPKATVPCDHIAMRKAVVDYAHKTCDLQDMFFVGLVCVELSDMIASDMKSTNKVERQIFGQSIVHESVDQYFQVSYFFA
jgi:uncharacterized UBP type Zn finger protein